MFTRIVRIALSAAVILTILFAGASRSVFAGGGNIYCAGGPNTRAVGSILTTSSPSSVKVGQVFQVGVTVYNNTSECAPFWAFIEIGGGAWHFPNGTGPRVTTGTSFQWSGPGSQYYSYRMVWSGWIKPRSHVNFYEPMESSGQAGKHQILSVVLHSSDPNSSFTVGQTRDITVQ